MEGRGKANFYHLYISRAYAVTHRLTFGGNGFAEREKNSRAHPYVSAVRVCERVFDFAAPRMFENPSLFFAAKWKKNIYYSALWPTVSLGWCAQIPCMSSPMAFDSKSFQKCHAREAWIAAHIFSSEIWIHSHVRRADSLFWFWSNMIWLVSHGNDCCFAWQPAVFLFPLASFLSSFVRS